MADRFGRIRDSLGAEAVATISGCYHKENALAATFLFSYLTGTPNVLDANHLYADGRYIPYDKANFYVDSNLRTFIDDE
jgi:hypothetical protein